MKIFKIQAILYLLAQLEIRKNVLYREFSLPESELFKKFQVLRKDLRFFYIWRNFWFRWNFHKLEMNRWNFSKTPVNFFISEKVFKYCFLVENKIWLKLILLNHNEVLSMRKLWKIISRLEKFFDFCTYENKYISA